MKEISEKYTDIDTLMTETKEQKARIASQDEVMAELQGQLDAVK